MPEVVMVCTTLAKAIRFINLRPKHIWLHPPIKQCKLAMLQFRCAKCVLFVMSKRQEHQACWCADGYGKLH